jgi:tetratricopeptide (TPR) repeat protein
MLIVLDNAESILDPQGTDGREIYGVVEELSQISNVCLVITSRITTVPSNCETIEIPTLSTVAAHETFDHIYKYGKRSDSVDEILKQLDFHPLSVTLLATVAHQNRWDNNRLVREWEQRRTNVLRTEHRTSLATTIELSLDSPMFKELGPDARGLLGVIAFYPQGVNENNVDWLFPTIPNVTLILDKFCILSLTYRSNGFTTMLAPLRDHLRPQNLKSSPLLCTTKDHYFARMSVDLDPGRPGFEDARWIVSEDVNVEHLLDTLTSTEPDSNDIWDASINFMRHLQWQKPRQIVLLPKIEVLPDNHSSKPQCLFEAGVLIGVVGDCAEGSRLFKKALELERERRNDYGVARTLDRLSICSRNLGLRKEGIRQTKEASGIHERLGDIDGRAWSLIQLAQLLCDEGQLDEAEEAALHSIRLLPEKSHEYEVCRAHRTLGNIYRSKGEREKAIHHLEVALGIASSFTSYDHLFWTHFSLAVLFLAEGKFDDAYSHAKQVQAHAPENPHHLGRAASLQARILYRQHRFEDATCEALRAREIFENVGALEDLAICKTLLQDIEQAAESRRSPVGQIPA